MNQVPVVKVWWDQASRIAHSCTYRVLASEPLDRWYIYAHVEDQHKVAAAEFCSAKSFWFATVSRWRDEGLSDQQCGKFFNCRCAGVNLAKRRGDLSCWCRLCPFCYFRAKTKLVASHKRLLALRSTRAAVLEVPVPAASWMSPEGYNAFLREVVVPARKQLISTTAAKNGFATVDIRLKSNTVAVQIAVVAADMSLKSNFELSGYGPVVAHACKPAESFTFSRMDKGWFNSSWSDFCAVAQRMALTRVVSVT